MKRYLNDQFEAGKPCMSAQAASKYVVHTKKEVFIRIEERKSEESRKRVHNKV